MYALQIAAVSLSVRGYVAEKTSVKALKFITCVLIPPPKTAVLAELGIPVTTGEKPEVKKPEALTRRASVDVRAFSNSL